MKRVLFVAFGILLVVISTNILMAQEEAPAPASVAKETSQPTEEKQEIKIVKTDPFKYCAIEMTGSYDQHSQGFATLYAEATKQNLPMTQIPFGIYWDNPAETPEEELSWDIGFRVPEDTKVEEPLKLKPWIFTMLATTKYYGAPDSKGMTDTYMTLFSWIGENGFRIVGPIMERYLSVPKTTEQGEMAFSIEIMVPIQKAETEPESE